MRGTHEKSRNNWGAIAGASRIAADIYLGDKTDLRSYRDTEIEELRDPITDAVAREFQLGTLAAPMDTAMLETMVRESRKVPARVWRAAFDGLFADSFCAGLPALNLPVLLLWGSADAFVPRADCDTLRSVLPSAQLRAYEGAGHALHWEQPARVAHELRRFVESLQAREAMRDSLDAAWDDALLRAR